MARPCPAWGRGSDEGARARWLSRDTLYRHRTAAAAAAPRPARRGPVGAYSDIELLEHIRAQILGSRLHGEGYRKIWAPLRHTGIRTSARRVRRPWASMACSRRTGLAVRAVRA